MDRGDVAQLGRHRGAEAHEAGDDAALPRQQLGRSPAAGRLAGRQNGVFCGVMLGSQNLTMNINM